MTRIGILQGRILPPSSEKLQIFPDKYIEEFLLIKQLGFDYIELLDDKENVLRNLIKKNKNFFIEKIEQSHLKIKSICMDNLCKISLINQYDDFSKNLDELLHLFKGMEHLIFIIPFFDENLIKNDDELFQSLKKISHYDSLLNSNNQYFSLEIDLPANIVYEQIKKFDFTNIKICYDLGNRINGENNLSDEIMLLDSYINHVHVKDKKEGINIRLRKKLDDFNIAFDTLKKINYNGTFILETNPFPKPLEEAKSNLETVKRYLEDV